MLYDACRSVRLPKRLPKRVRNEPSRLISSHTRRRFSNEDSVELQLNDTSHLETSQDLEAIANEFLTEQQAYA